MILSSLNRDADALAALDKALALAPDDLPALNGRGIVLLKLDRAEEAVAAFERVLQRDPRFISAGANRGNALAQLGRFDEALAQYDAVLALRAVARRNAFQPRHCAIETRPPARRHRGLRPRAGAAAGLRQGAHQSRHRAAGLQSPSANRSPISVRCWRVDKDNADAHHNEGLALLDARRLSARL